MALPQFHINLKDWEFEFRQRGEQPILLSDWYCRSVAHRFSRTFKLDIGEYDYLFTQSSRGYVKIKQKRDILRKLRAAIEDRKYLARILEKSVGVMKEFGCLASEISRAIAKPKISNLRLAAYWEKLDREFTSVIPWFWAPYYIAEQNMITDKVKHGLERYRERIEKITDLNNVLLLVTFPVKAMALQREQVDFYKLVSYAESKRNFEHDPRFTKQTVAYLRKYDWMTTFLLMPVLSMSRKELVGRIKKALKGKYRTDFEIQQKVKRENATKAKRIIHAVKNDVKLLGDIKAARELGYALTAGVEEALRSAAKYLPFLQLVAKRLAIPFRSIRLLRSAEIYDGLLGGAIPDSQELSLREKGYIMAVIKGRQHVIYGSRGLKLSQRIDRELDKVDHGISELKGQPASPGLAHGKVRIALEPSQSHALKKKEILVCPMTNPDYVPAMRRSAAIITDEGGLLSHAAIMSREFGKPCVVGTKIATRVLKSGDLVEVDADKGVVKVLKTSKN